MRLKFRKKSDCIVTFPEKYKSPNTRKAKLATSLPKNSLTIKAFSSYYAAKKTGKSLHLIPPHKGGTEYGKSNCLLPFGSAGRHGTDKTADRYCCEEKGHEKVLLHFIRFLRSCNSFNIDGSGLQVSPSGYYHARHCPNWNVSLTVMLI